jgi:plastocyanin
MRGICRFILVASVGYFCACSGSHDKSAPAKETVANRSYFHVDPSTAAVLTGTIRFTGKRPRRKPVDLSSDPACVKAHGGAAYDESIVVGEGGKLANAFVYIKGGLDGKIFETPATPVTMDQHGCWFRPRVIGVQTGQILRVTNTDPVSHNIHPLPHDNREWNHSQGAGADPLERKFARPEVMIPVKCNIHSWMHAFIGVVGHPYFAVSGGDGSFEIRNVPPGDYVVEAWQEKLGTIERNVTLAASATAKVDFTFSAKEN